MRRTGVTDMKIVALSLAAAGLLAGIAPVPALADAPIDWTTQPRAAFVAAYVFGCQPVEQDFAGAREPLNTSAARVYDELFVSQYREDCADFYFKEVVPRLDPDLRPHFLPAAR
jgi:hypothetical protein